MRSRRIIGLALALAVLVGQSLVPMARAACAASHRKAPACPSCASEPAGSGLSLSIDRSCCAPPASLSDREPATLNSDQTGGDHRAQNATSAAAPTPGLADRFDTAPIVPSAPPEPSPPRFRTTILLI